MSSLEVLEFETGPHPVASLIVLHGLPAFCRALYNTNELITIY